jgi:hypothetical protein
MGTIAVRRQDRSDFTVRTSKRTRHIRLGPENPVAVDLSKLGDTPALEEISLNYRTTLETLDLAPLAGHPGLTSFSARVATVVDLTPFATCRKLNSLALSIGGDEVLDFAPLHGHRTLASVSIDYAGMQPALDLSFTKKLPALESLSISGGEWRTLDLRPLKGRALRSLALYRQYISKVDLDVIAQPALEHLMLQELEINEPYFSLLELRRCPKLKFVSLLGNEIRSLDVSGLAKLKELRRFDPPNCKEMMMMPQFTPITAPGLLVWQDSIGVD